MILAEFDTRKFSWKIVANTIEEAMRLAEKAWEKHRAQYPEAVSWERLQDLEYFTDPRITELVCGTVLRDNEVLLHDPNAPQFLDVAVISHRHGFDAFVGEGDTVNARLREWVDENWNDIEGLCDTPDKPDVITEETVDTYFEISQDSQGDSLEYNEACPVMQVPPT